MKLALIAGTGALPAALIARLEERPLVCALEQSKPDLAVDLFFRLETLGTLLDRLRESGVTHVCMAGAVQRPRVDPDAVDAATVPLLPVLMAALSAGDDGALRAVIGVFEAAGFTIRAAHEIAPDLLPRQGVLTREGPQPWHRADAHEGALAVARLGAADRGQACVVRHGEVIATEGPEGTAAMLKASVPDGSGAGDPFFRAVDMVSDMLGDMADWLSAAPDQKLADDGILFKAPKPGQDLRADLPVIGPDTALLAARAGLGGIVIAAGGVMVLDQAAVVAILDENAMFLWVRSER